MIEAFQVHQLVNQYVIAHGRRHQDQSPIERDVAVTTTRSPARALIADAHPRDGQSVLSGNLHQPQRQLRPRPLAQRRSLLRSEGGWRESRALPRYPIGVTLHEGIGLALGSTARDGDPHTTVMFDAQQIPPRAAMADEVDRVVPCRWNGTIACRCEGPDACRGKRTVAGRCKLTVDCRCDRSSACRLASPKTRRGEGWCDRVLAHLCARIVDKRQTELHVDRITDSQSLYCVRSAVSGFTALARRAGSQTAISETIVSTSGITMNTAGSRACT